MFHFSVENFKEGYRTENPNFKVENRLFFYINLNVLGNLIVLNTITNT